MTKWLQTSLRKFKSKLFQSTPRVVENSQSKIRAELMMNESKVQALKKLLMTILS